MFFVIHAIICSFILIYHASGNGNFQKPSFAPYCAIKNKCKSACNCQGPPNCSLIPMDDAIRESISFYHNQIRQIQALAEPEPSGMTMLEYDMQLEEISKCWASKCDNEYSTCFFTPTFPETSQSVTQMTIKYAEKTNPFFWIKIFNFWFGETESLTADSISALPGGEKGERLHNFAQLVGDNIRFVGCSWSYIKDSVTFVCSYGPRGPVWGEPIYKRGKSCTSCPEGYGCDKSKPFENLCKRGVGVSTVPPVETPPLPPPLAPVEVPPAPPPLASTSPPPVTQKSKCYGSSNCKGIQKSEAVEQEPIISIPGSDFGKARKGSDSPLIEEESGIWQQGYDYSKSDKTVHSSFTSSPNHMRLAHNNAPLVPLRHTPHSSIPITRISTAIVRNRSHLHQYVPKDAQQKPGRMMEPIDSEPSQLVPSYHSTYDSPLNEQGQFFPSFRFQPPKSGVSVAQEFKDNNVQLLQQQKQSQGSQPMHIYPRSRQEEVKSPIQFRNQNLRQAIPNTQSTDLEATKRAGVHPSLQPSPLRQEGMEQSPKSPDSISISPDSSILQYPESSTTSPKQKSSIVQHEPLNSIKPSHRVPPTSRASLGEISGKYHWGNSRIHRSSSLFVLISIFLSLITFCNGQ